MSPKRRTIGPDCTHRQNSNRKSILPKQKKESNGYVSQEIFGVSDTYKSPGDYVFPANTILLIHVVTIIIRVAIATDKGNWWILHPDEVYQTVEIAHSEVYGYGFRPYEYLPAPESNSTHIPDLQRAALGMYGLRSFLLPRMFMVLFYVKEQLGLQTNPFLLARIFHAMIAANLPFAVFYFLRHTVKSRDTRFLASILVATSEHLTVLGTHTLVNSFLAPFVFFFLGWFLELTSSNQNPIREEEDAILNVTYSSTGALLKPYNCLNVNEKQNSFTKHANIDPKVIRNGAAKGKGCTSNNNNNKNNKMCYITNCQENATVAVFWNFSKYSKQIASCLIGFNVEIIIHTFKSMSDMVPISIRIVVGISLGILVYIRVDLILLVGSVIVVFYVFNNLSNMEYLAPNLPQFALGGCIGIVLGGWDDYTCYGVWFISPYQWFRFNVYRDLSTTIFGKGESSYYVQELFIRDGYSIILCLGVLIAIITSTAMVRFGSHSSVTNTPLFRFTLVFVCLLAFYSAKGHKELRFVHNVIVIYLVISALSFDLLIDLLCNLLNRTTVRKLAYALTVFSAFWHLFLRCGTLKDKNVARWSYQGTTDSGHVNSCLDFIGQQDDVTGIFLDKTIHMTGGYSVLHKDVPILALIHYEYYEFGKSARQSTYSKFGNQDGKEIHVSVLSHISDFFSVDNSLLLVKHIIDNKVYNYVVIEADRPILDNGFRKVFSTGRLQVMRRHGDGQSEISLKTPSDQIPIGSNSTVLEFEGSWLLTFGLYHKALSRLHEALRLDRDRVKLYQLLSTTYGALGDMKAAKKQFSQCKQLHGQKCSQPQPKIVLH